MNLNELNLSKSKLKKLLESLKLLKKKSNNKYYLTIGEKKELLKDGKRIPLRVKGNGRDIKLLVKTRGTIESGELKNKRMGL